MAHSVSSKGEEDNGLESNPQRNTPTTFIYVYQVINFGPQSKGPSLDPRTFDITPIERTRALLWLRTTCGSDQFLDRENGMMKALLTNIRPDGLMYYPRTDLHPKTFPTRI